MACNPPFCHGSGGWCDCSCGCCPPDDCGTITIAFKCGTPSDIYPSGCVCATPFRMRNTKKPIYFPKFTQEKITSENGEFVFAQSCSVPCTDTTVTLTTTGCCLELLGGVIYAIGAGTITATASPSTGSDSCGTLTPKINGTPNTLDVADCTILTITMSGEDEDCCPCCAGITTLLDPTPFTKKRRTINQKALTKFRLNVKQKPRSTSAEPFLS